MFPSSKFNILIAPTNILLNFVAFVYYPSFNIPKGTLLAVSLHIFEQTWPKDVCQLTKNISLKLFIPVTILYVVWNILGSGAVTGDWVVLCTGSPAERKRQTLTLHAWGR
jgi:hypothetical protein